MKVFLSTTLLGISAIAYSSYEYLRPKNIEQYLQWKGYRLVSDNENIWKAIFEENNDYFTSFKELRNYCLKQLKKDNYQELEKVTKYCIDSIKTVKGELIREGLLDKLMSEKEQYKVALFLRSHNYEFLNTVGIVNTAPEKIEKTDPARLIIDIADIFSNGAIYLKDKDSRESFWAIDFSTTKDKETPKGFKESNTSFEGKAPSLNTIGYSNEEEGTRKNYLFEDTRNSENIKNLSSVFSEWAKDATELKFFSSNVRTLSNKATGFTVWKKHKEHWYHFNIAWKFNKVYHFEQAALWGVHFPYVDRYTQHQYLESGNLIPVAIEELRVLNYINSKSDIFKSRGYKTRRLPDSLFIRHILSPTSSPLSTKEINEMYEGETKIVISKEDIESLKRGSWRDRWGNWFINDEKVEKEDPIEKYKAWCESSLLKSTSANRLLNTKNFCFGKGFRTAEEKLKHDGITRLNELQLRDKYDEVMKFKEHPLFKDLKGEGIRNNKEAFGKAYLEYCNNEGNKAIYEMNYSKYLARCSFKN